MLNISILNSFTMKEKTKIEDVLKYENDKVISIFLRNNNISKIEANEIFSETLKWLYLCYKAGDKINLSITSELHIIDEMWHSFIICTLDYEIFCHSYFNQFIHHEPNVNTNSNANNEDIIKNNLKIELEFIYDTLGEETFYKWFYTYPEKYGME